MINKTTIIGNIFILEIFIIIVASMLLFFTSNKSQMNPNLWVFNSCTLKSALFERTRASVGEKLHIFYARYSTAKENHKDFYSDLLAYQVAILTLLLPISFEITSRFSDRYNSDKLSKRFLNEPLVLSMILFSFFNLLWLISARFFANQSLSILTLTHIFALISALLFSSFLYLVTQYGSNIEFVKRKIFLDAQSITKTK